MGMFGMMKTIGMPKTTVMNTVVNSRTNLVITLVDEQDTVVKDKLIPLPAQLQNMWLRLVNKDVVAAGDREMELFNRLERAGLVEVDESETHLFLRVKHGKEHYKSYNIWDKLQERHDLEHILLSLAGI